MSALALVTGTSRGIGAAVARELLERGWRVLGVARGAPADGLEGGAYRHERVDLSDLAQLEAFGDGTLRDALGDARPARVGLVNNAGTLSPLGPLPELPLAELARATVVNALAPVYLTGCVLRHAPDAATRIVDLSSGAATSAYPGWTAYCSTKAALKMAGDVLAVELDETESLRGRDVALVSYAPHVVATRMQEELRATPESAFPRRARFVALHEEGALVAPEGPAAEIADVLEADDLPRHSTRRYQP